MHWACTFLHCYNLLPFFSNGGSVSFCTKTANTYQDDSRPNQLWVDKLSTPLDQPLIVKTIILSVASQSISSWETPGQHTRWLLALSNYLCCESTPWRYPPPPLAWGSCRGGASSYYQHLLSCRPTISSNYYHPIQDAYYHRWQTHYHRTQTIRQVTRHKQVNRQCQLEVLLS